MDHDRKLFDSRDWQQPTPYIWFIKSIFVKDILNFILILLPITIPGLIYFIIKTNVNYKSLWLYILIIFSVFLSWLFLIYIDYKKFKLGIQIYKEGIKIYYGYLKSKEKLIPIHAIERIERRKNYVLIVYGIDRTRTKKLVLSNNLIINVDKFLEVINNLRMVSIKNPHNSLRSSLQREK